MLTPLYELIDWPYSNPGLGSVFDWGGISGNYDRQSNQVRYDSPDLGNMKFAFSVGRNQNPDGAGSSGAQRNVQFVGSHLKYKISSITLMTGFEYGKRKAEAPLDDYKNVMAYLLGFDAALPSGIGLAAAYKHKKNDAETQDSYSIVTQYWSGPIGIKLGYAANLESNLNNSVAKPNPEPASHTTSVQVMASYNGFTPYIRLANRQGDELVSRVGLEFNF